MWFRKCFQSLHYKKVGVGNLKRKEVNDTVPFNFAISCLFLLVFEAL